LPTLAYEKTYEEWQKAANEDSTGVNAEKINKEGLYDTVYSGIHTLTGVDQKGEPVGAIQFTTKLIASIYAAPPASGVYYAYDVLHHLGVAPAMAANGVGFTGLQPILPIWKAFRNVTYILFTIIFIGIGLAIMFRVKISPQAVITIENALPRIIGALILVTFSYAIAGFLIDLMYVLMFLLIAILGGAGITNANAQWFANAGFSHLAGSMFAPIFYGIDDFGRAFLTGNFLAISSLVGAGIGIAIGSLVAPGAGTVIGALSGLLGGGAATAVVGPALVTLILLIIVLFLLFKIFFKLLGVYLSIIIGIIFSPLQISLGALPISSPLGGFSAWIKNLMANLLVFPAITVMLIISYHLTRTVSGDPNITHSTTLWVPPFLGGWGSSMTAIIGIGMLFIIAKVPDIIKGIMGQKDLGFGSAIGEAMRPAETVGKFGIRQGARAGGVYLLERKAEKYGVDSKWETAANIAESLGFYKRPPIPQKPPKS